VQAIFFLFFLHISKKSSNFAGKIETDETNRHAKDTEKNIP
jgi:hypothetical protein